MRSLRLIPKAFLTSDEARPALEVLTQREVASGTSLSVTYPVRYTFYALCLGEIAFMPR